MAESEVTKNFDLSSFARAKDKMIATNDNAYRNIRQTVHDLSISQPRF